MTKPSFFTKQIHFAWLLRGDVREKLLRESRTEKEAQKEFVAWWLLFGRKEYPESPGCTAEQIGIANEVVASGQTHTHTTLYRLNVGPKPPN